MKRLIIKILFRIEEDNCLNIMFNHKFFVRYIFLLFSIGLCSIAHASSPEAWVAFREDVRSSCDASVKDKLDNYSIDVDLYGTQSYGIAVADGLSKNRREREKYICIYNKKSKILEISGPFSGFNTLKPNLAYPIDAQNFTTKNIGKHFCDPTYINHKGVDIFVSEGKKVFPVCPGTIVLDYTNTEDISKYATDYERYFNSVLIIKHECNGLVFFGHYGHVKSNLKTVNVESGKEIGMIRKSYNENNERTPSNDHLHFGINTKNPMSSHWGIAERDTSCSTIESEGWVDPITFSGWN